MPCGERMIHFPARRFKSLLFPRAGVWPPCRDAQKGWHLACNRARMSRRLRPVQVSDGLTRYPHRQDSLALYTGRLNGGGGRQRWSRIWSPGKSGYRCPVWNVHKILAAYSADGESGGALNLGVREMAVDRILVTDRRFLFHSCFRPADHPLQNPDESGGRLHQLAITASPGSVGSSGFDAWVKLLVLFYYRYICADK